MPDNQTTPRDWDAEAKHYKRLINEAMARADYKEVRRYRYWHRRALLRGEA